MGVAGAGKSTVASAVAQRFSWPLLEGDDFHPPGNLAKMTAGVPLTNEDRTPWIAAICKAASALEAPACVISCSALNEVVREAFAKNFCGEITYIHLSVSKETLMERMKNRAGHFMPVSLVDSQLAALSPPARGYEIDAEKPLAQVSAQTAGVITKIMSTDENR